MKKLFFTMTSLLLMCIMVQMAKGEMISVVEAKREIAEENLQVWDKTYTAFGRKISVKAKIGIPDVEKIPILQVKAIMGKEVAEEMGLEKSPDQGNAGAGILYDDPYILSKLSDENSGVATVFCANPEEIDLAFLQSSYDKPNSKRYGNWGYISEYYYPDEINFETIYAEENEQSLFSANEQLKIVLQNYYKNKDVDYDIDYVEVRGRARKKVGRKKSDLGDYKKDYPKGTYYISFRQKMEGIPVYLDIGKKMLTTDKTHISQDVALKCSRVSWITINEFEYMDEASFIINATMLKIEKRIEEDVPIASVDKMIETIERAIEEGYIRDVYAVRLGYVCYLDETSPETYTLYPAWICDCVYANSAKEEITENVATDAFRENYRYEQIIIDAQTCEIQRGWISEDEGLFHEKAITW